MANDYSNYLSPFFRYGSKRMRFIWSEENKVKVWRQVWLSLAQSQFEMGLLNKKELHDLQKNSGNFDIERVFEIEKTTRHDVMAAILEFKEKAKIGGGKIHLGATSTDITDNADIIKIKQSLAIIKENLIQLLKIISKQVEKHADLCCMGYTHLQPAQPTTVGYRFSIYAQDLLIDFSIINKIEQEILKGKGLKGAVGTSASYFDLLNGDKDAVEKMEKLFLKKLNLYAFTVLTQVYTRKIDFWVLSLLVSIAQSCTKFANDLRILQSSGIGEWQEPFAKTQVGSSAMPFKRNPVGSEKICSLSRYLFHLPSIAAENAANSLLERTLDDSANRRIILAQGFIALEEILLLSQKIISGLVVNKNKIQTNLNKYYPFFQIEPLLMNLVKKGADRQLFHKKFRLTSLKVNQEIELNKPNHLFEYILKDKDILKYLNNSEIKKIFLAKVNTGDAEIRSKKLLMEIKKILKSI